MKIEVTGEVSEPRNVGNGTVREQEIWVHSGNAKYPQRSSISLWNNDSDIAPGNYTVDLESAVYIGRFNRLAITLRGEHLKPIKAAAAG